VAGYVERVMETVLILSRDRPMQLLCTLETLLVHGRGLEDTTIQVRLRARADVVLRQYYEVYERGRPLANLLFIEGNLFAGLRLGRDPNLL
jgi:hypothetical protein